MFSRFYDRTFRVISDRTLFRVISIAIALMVYFETRRRKIDEVSELAHWTRQTSRSALGVLTIHDTASRVGLDYAAAERQAGVRGSLVTLVPDSRPEE